MKSIVRRYLLIGAVLATADVTRADVITLGDLGVTGPSFPVSIPDNTAAGLAWGFFFDNPSLSSIGSISVSLCISGGFNGDLYAYLSHGDGFAVLLNRVGASISNPDGSPGSGFDLVLRHGNYPDIHLAAAATPLSAMLSAEGRLTYFSAECENTLGAFHGLDPAGDWTLFLADRAGGSISTVNGWSIDIQPMAAVPEPSHLLTMSVLGLCGVVFRTASFYRKRRITCAKCV
jgi:subtilisin-like proprotein convertase family protein